MTAVQRAILKLRNTPVAGEWVYLWQQLQEHIATLQCRVEDDPQLEAPLTDFRNQLRGVEDCLCDMAAEMLP